MRNRPHCRKWVALAALVLACASCSPRSKSIAFDKTPVPMVCRLLLNGEVSDKREPCQMFLASSNDYTEKRPRSNIYQWRLKSGGVVTFAGSREYIVPWWFGTLNDKRAAGYAVGREHHVFATEDGSIQFETWKPGWEHGEY